MNKNQDSKYADFLTVILIIVIIAILGLGGYFVYTIYKGKKVEEDAQSALNEFNKKVPTKNTTSSNTTTNEVTNTNLDDILDQFGTETDADNSSQSSSSSNSSREKVYLEGYEVMGSIKIPKTGIEYPILSKVTIASLEASVAIQYGVGLNQLGNTTIVGHNLRNGRFFSNNYKLSEGDKIIIKDNEGIVITYTIYEMSYKDPYDTDYMLRDTEGYREISLSTCNNDSSQRLVILARES